MTDDREAQVAALAEALRDLFALMPPERVPLLRPATFAAIARTHQWRKGPGESLACEECGEPPSAHRLAAHPDLASKVAAASPTAPAPRTLRLTGAQLASIDPPIPDEWFTDWDEHRDFVEARPAAIPGPALDVRAAEQRVIAAARDLNATMPDTGDGDPLQDLDDALLALDAALGPAPEAGSREANDAR